MSGGGGIQTTQGPGAFSPSTLLTLIKTVDGTSSGLDADLVRGTTPTTAGLSVLALTSIAAGGLILGSGANAVGTLAIGTSGYVLRSNGTTAAWAALDAGDISAGTLAAARGGTGVSNAGTLTNASNTTITGGGTLALGGFTLTVPATGTAGLLGTAQTWSAANIFSALLTTTENCSLAAKPGAVAWVSAGDNSSGAGAFRAFGSSAQIGWQIGSNITTANALEFTPATAVGGTTFTTPALVLLTGSATFASSCPVRIGDGSSQPSLSINGAANNARSVQFQTAGVNRWNFLTTSGTESGSDTGSPFAISAYADNGAYIDDPLNIVRAAGGTFTIARPLSVTGATLTLADATNVVVNATTGTKIGTATTQKLSLWNATPIVQPSSTGETTGWTSGGGSAATSTDTYTGNTGTKAYTVNDIVKHLKNIGALAAS